MTKRIKYIVVSILLLWNSGSTFSQSFYNDSSTYHPLKELWGIGLKASTNGFGAEVIKGFGKKQDVRFGFTKMNLLYSQTLSHDGYAFKANADLHFGGIHLLYDYHFFKGIFITAGAVVNKMKHNISVSMAESILIGDLVIPPGSIGTINAILEPGITFSPYLALGFGKSLSRNKKFSISGELGTLYHGNPNFIMNGDGMIKPIAGEYNTSLLQEAIKPYKWFPILSFQISYRIF